MEAEEQKPSNPPAHPTQRESGSGYIYVEEGMTLRDYFAAKAIVNLKISLKPKTFLDRIKLFLRNFGFENEVNYERQYDCQSDAEYCYLLADAMLKQREL